MISEYCLPARLALVAALLLVTQNATASLPPGTVVIADGSLDALVAVDPITGVRTIISDDDTGSGTGFRSPTAITLDAAGNLLVSDTLLDAIVSVDPATGDRTIISDDEVPDPSDPSSSISIGTGPPLQNSNGIALSPTGTIYTADNSSALDGVVQINPVTGNRFILSNEDNGTGPDTNFPSGIAVRGDGTIIYMDIALDAMIAVNPLTGNRTLFSDDTNGIGPIFGAPTGITVSSTGDFLVTDIDFDAVYLVDAFTGDRTILSDDFTGSGPILISPDYISEATDGTIYVTDDSNDRVYAIDPVTGDRTVLVSDTVGSGPEINRLEGIFVMPGIALPIPGDYNSDGLVDAADYTVWRDTLGATGVTPLSGADGNGDGEVTIADYSLWKSNYDGLASPAAASNIPEPATFVLASLMFFVAAGRRQ